MLDDFRSSRLISTVLAGALSGVVSVSLAISMGALVFRGDLANSVENGIGLALFGSFVGGVIVALGSSRPGIVAGVGGKTAAVLGVSAASIAHHAAVAHRVSTVVALIATASLLTGLVLLALGWGRLGGAVRFVPYPVVAGFMSATGLLIIIGAWGVVRAGAPASQLLKSNAMGRWLPAVGIAGLMYVAGRVRQASPVALPVVVIASTVGLRVGYWAAGLSRSDAFARGWLLGSFHGGSSWKPKLVADAVHADWSAVFREGAGLGTIAVLTLASVLLYAHALSIDAEREIDLNRELRATGLACLAAGLGGGMPTYIQMPSTVLAQDLVGPRRGTALVAACVVGAALAAGSSFLATIPTAVAAGVLLYVGVTHLGDALWEVRGRLSRLDQVLVLAILVAVIAFGFLPGIAFGIVIALSFFVVRYSQIDVVLREGDGHVYHSNLARPAEQLELLNADASRLLVLELRGYLFFGTAHGLVERLQSRVRSGGSQRLEFLVLDFAGVTGLDSSAVMSLHRIVRLAESEGFELVLTQFDRLQRDADALFAGADGSVIHAAPDLDHGVEWCEERLLSRRNAAPPDELDLRGRLMAALHDEAAVEAVLRHVEWKNLPAGSRLAEFAAPSPGLYFLGSGRITAVLEHPGAEPLRLRTLLPGAIVGEVSLYLGRPVTATLICDTDVVAAHLTPERLLELSSGDPAAAAAVHRYVAATLAERLTHAESAVRALRT